MSVIHINSPEEFDSLLSSTMYTIVDFTASWCGPCKAISPQLDKLATQHSIPEYLAFAKVDVDEVQTVAQRFGISAMPTFMFFKEGNQVAVNGQALIRGADVRSLTAAAEKLGGLAIEKKGSASEQQ